MLPAPPPTHPPAQVANAVFTAATNAVAVYGSTFCPVRQEDLVLLRSATVDVRVAMPAPYVTQFAAGTLTLGALCEAVRAATQTVVFDLAQIALSVGRRSSP